MRSIDLVCLYSFIFFSSLLSARSSPVEDYDLISDDAQNQINVKNLQNNFLPSTTNSVPFSNHVIPPLENPSASNEIFEQETSGQEEPSNFLSELKKIIHNKIIPFLRNALGLIVIILGVVFLWFNEKRAVDIARIVNFGEQACEDAIPSQYDPELNGELVYISGKISTNCQLHDQTFGVYLQDGIKLKRVVEVYHMKEIKAKKASLFRNAQYKYEKGWYEFMNPSAMFHEDSMREVNNDARFIAHKMTFTADTVELENFRLSPYQIQRLDKWVPLELTGPVGTTFSRDFKERLNSLRWKNPPIINVQANCVSIKQSEGEEPQIGDMRISFYKIPCDVVSIIAEQAGITFKPYNIKERRFIKQSEADKSSLLDDEEFQFDLSLEKGVDRCCWGVFCSWANSRIKNPLKVRETIDFIYPGKLYKRDFFTSQMKLEKWYFTNSIRLLGTALLTLGIFISYQYEIERLAFIRLLYHITDLAKLVGYAGLGGMGSLLVAGFAWMFYKKLTGFMIILLTSSLLGSIFVCQELNLS